MIAMLEPVLAALSLTPGTALALWIFFAPAAMVGAYSKRRSFVAWTTLALLLGPLALLALACLGQPGIPCHKCQEPIGPHDRVCGFCGVPRFERRSRSEDALDWIRERVVAVDEESPLDLRGLAALAVAVVLGTVAVLATAAAPPAPPSYTDSRLVRPAAAPKPFQLTIMAEARPRTQDLRRAMSQACTSDVLDALERVFPERQIRRSADGQPSGGHVVPSAPLWNAEGLLNREASLRTASLCIFGGGSFEVRDGQTGRSLAEWSQVAGYIAHDGG